MPIRDTIDRKRSFAGGVRGFKLGLTISALQENQQRIFEMFNLWAFFSVIITGEDITNGKPHPEPYLKTAKKAECCSGKRTGH